MKLDNTLKFVDKATSLNRERRKKHTCYICMAKFSALADLRRHKFIHKREEPDDIFTEEGTTKESGLPRILPVTKLNSDSSVKITNVNSTNENNLSSVENVNSHTSNATSVKSSSQPFRCLSCTLSFNNLADLEAHEEGISNCIFSCNMCKIFVNRKDIFLFHMKMHSMRPQNYFTASLGLNNELVDDTHVLSSCLEIPSHKKIVFDESVENNLRETITKVPSISVDRKTGFDENALGSAEINLEDTPEKTGIDEHALGSVKTNLQDAATKISLNIIDRERGFDKIALGSLEANFQDTTAKVPSNPIEMKTDVGESASDSVSTNWEETTTELYTSEITCDLCYDVFNSQEELDSHLDFHKQLQKDSSVMLKENEELEINSNKVDTPLNTSTLQQINRVLLQRNTKNTTLRRIRVLKKNIVGSTETSNVKKNNYVSILKSIPSNNIYVQNNLVPTSSSPNITASGVGNVLTSPTISNSNFFYVMNTINNTSTNPFQIPATIPTLMIDNSSNIEYYVIPDDTDSNASNSALVKNTTSTDPPIPKITTSLTEDSQFLEQINFNDVFGGTTYKPNNIDLTKSYILGSVKKAQTQVPQTSANLKKSLTPTRPKTLLQQALTKRRTPVHKPNILLQQPRYQIIVPTAPKAKAAKPMMTLVPVSPSKAKAAKPINALVPVSPSKAKVAKPINALVPVSPSTAKAAKPTKEIVPVRYTVRKMAINPQKKLLKKNPLPVISNVVSLSEEANRSSCEEVTPPVSVTVRVLNSGQSVADDRSNDIESSLPTNLIMRGD